MYVFEDIARLSGGRLLGDGKQVVRRLVFDTRLVVEGGDAVFFALSDGLKDGHRYLQSAWEKGIRHFVVAEGKSLPSLSGARFVVVPEVLAALQALGREHRRRFHFPIMALTGSNGKTIVKEWLGQTLGLAERVCRSPRSYNSQLGVPLSLWHLKEEDQLGIFEAGISRPGEMERLREMIQPDWGLLTNIGAAHQEYFASEEEKLDEKLKLFTACSLIFYGCDHELVRHKVQARFGDKHLLSWGRCEQADLRLLEAAAEPQGQRLSLEWKGQPFSCFLPFRDAISLENVLPVILVLLYKGYSFADLSPLLGRLQAVAMRMEQKEGVSGCTLINDSYNSDLTSLETALGFLEQVQPTRRCLILSDLFQTGISDEDLYPRVAKMIGDRGIERFIGVGEVLGRYASFFESGALFFDTTEALLKTFSQLEFRQEAILIKGARAFQFERLVERLERKQHNTIMEINLDALVHNFNVFRSKLQPGVKTLAMVKAFGYGSGLFEIASVLQHHKVDYLGVAFADEGVELRQAGISLPIVVMNPEEKSFPQMLAHGLEPEIYSFRMLEAWNRMVVQEGTDFSRIHLKVDSGMYRLGFFEEEAEQLLAHLRRMPQLQVASVFSHLAGSDEARHDAFTREQAAVFQRFCAQLQGGLEVPFLRHLLNSAGVERFPQFQFDMVRLGIGLYGIGAASDGALQTVATLKTYISQIKTVKAGATIGYGRRGVLPEGSRIAVLPIGYADGLSRGLSNGRGGVNIGGQMVPIVGNICMDMCMVDVSRLSVKEGDEVVVFGEEPSVSEVAELLGTIPYEILTGISRRVKRVYFKE
ncbi:bifunctional UDP-N-acetylmuramoyl-tripeptide:D-alanyl-D-alanine ligase/alanine racemase [Geofilum rhodophaeum]|uniref:bifunctional UDP-N-acetylmuramoyl-tripeptide:D-alanyl-D-alanine ligase/alanine racemase n=1 Tax=Geofilum rhodophaeum TaxID=1965019 RepID=UPI000B525083|nr:bifunctional UDP-N-acetylmuramoyl-tripeptide:D-alanyl-D-alanine ligase/alanine racemase [Geofilum rhodophaeum]